jgi:glutamate-1-semialdehyde 2,1-aminomutase
MTEEVAERIADHMRMLETTDVGGIGGTLAGNELSLAAARATLEEVLTDEAFGHMTEMAERFEAGVNEVVAAPAVPWNSVRLGCRVEYHFQSSPPRNGSEAVAANDRTLGRYMHLQALNRGILLTPFHNMALMCPATTEADVDRHTEAFEEAVAGLTGKSSA